MSVTKVRLDRQATAKTFDFGTAAASDEGLVTIYKGTAAATTVVLDVKGSQNIGGDLNLTGNLKVTGSIDTQTVTNTNVADVTITLNDGGTTPTDDTAGVIMEGTSNTIVGALKYKAASATKWSVGTGAAQDDIVGLTATQALTNKTYNGNTFTAGTGVLTIGAGQTLTVTTGGTLGTAAYTASSAYQTADTQLTSLAALVYSGNSLKSIRLNVGETDFEFYTPTTGVTQKSTVVSGTQDSANKIFTIANTLATGSEQVYVNGQLLMPGANNDYVYNGTTTVTFQSGFTAPAATDVIRVYGGY